MYNNTYIIKDTRPNFLKNISYTSKFILIFFGTILIIKIYHDLSHGVQIFGDKNNSFFDAWSLEHIITGMSMSYFFLLFEGPFSKAMQKNTCLEIKYLKDTKQYSQTQLKNLSKLLQNKDKNNKIIHHSLIVISISLAWEIVEHYMEVAIFEDYGIEKYFYDAQVWFSGVEIFLNRFFLDPLLVYFGWFIVRQKPILSKIAAPISLLWLITHIIVFKDSMFLHKHSFEEIFTKLTNLDMLKALLITTLISLIITLIKTSMQKNAKNLYNFNYTH